uniref:Uncharacterized protein n=1 Tax=Anguilla anguilla TaxID=7936 RepID=A0A0E9P734_ANGAN
MLFYLNCLVRLSKFKLSGSTDNPIDFCGLRIRLTMKLLGNLFFLLIDHKVC